MTLEQVIQRALFVSDHYEMEDPGAYWDQTSPAESFKQPYVRLARAVLDALAVPEPASPAEGLAKPESAERE